MQARVTEQAKPDKRYGTVIFGSTFFCGNCGHWMLMGYDIRGAPVTISCQNLACKMGGVRFGVPKIPVESV